MEQKDNCVGLPQDCSHRSTSAEAVPAMHTNATTSAAAARLCRPSCNMSYTSNTLGVDGRISPHVHQLSGHTRSDCTPRRPAIDAPRASKLQGNVAPHHSPRVWFSESPATGGATAVESPSASACHAAARLMAWRCHPRARRFHLIITLMKSWATDPLCDSNRTAHVRVHISAALRSASGSRESVGRVYCGGSILFDACDRHGTTKWHALGSSVGNE